ncbi:helix-turn-helix domain-containing protein [Oscillospiraceae bacterium HV4-5-C5C]|nr:helix-turn-helix domain-containing protein [Oscillospiraceae bacterium HV4-5-C5C]
MLRLSINDPDALARICHALSTRLRLDILTVIQTDGPLSCQQLAQQLDCPLSTISTNIKVLEDAGLVLADFRPARNGSQKLCSLVYQDVALNLSAVAPVSERRQSYQTPVLIGNYQLFEARPSCGFVSQGEQGLRIEPERFDNPYCFLDPERIQAGLLWFRQGYVEYHIPLPDRKGQKLQRLQFSMELCSEAPGFNSKWQSDITLWINDHEVGTFVSPADCGDRRGLLTPAEWGLGNTQYGFLCQWEINHQSSLLNGEICSELVLKDLELQGGGLLRLRLGVKHDAQHVGGLNLFGHEFGDYAQDILMTEIYGPVLEPKTRPQT